MDHYFEVPVNHKNEELLFNGRLATFAYDYKFYVNVQGKEIVFERDDEEKLRAVMPNADAATAIDKELIEKIVEVLESLRAVR